MKKKAIIGISILSILFLNISVLTGMCIPPPYNDELDQFQTVRGGDNNQAAIGGPTYCFAQSFKPTLNTLTRIELLIVRAGNPSGNLIISIRNDLNGNDLTSAEIPSEQISIHGEWYELDFPDIQIPPEYPLYIIWHPASESWDDDNLLLCACNWEPDLYIRGEMWVEYPSENWYIENPNSDLCFKTYGYNRENEPPNIPNITGPTDGAIEEEHQYTIYTNDNDSDEVYYFIEWGDGTNSSWIGPYSSGHQVKMSHIWKEKGDYQIKVKAKDIFYEESDWATLEITMPRNKALQTPFLQILKRFLENHPNLFPILRYLLGL